jgi:hypothetical protein
MKILSVLLLGIWAASTLAADPPAQPAPQTITKDIVRKAIAVFRQEPASENGKAAASTILHFAQESPDVEVTMSHTALPWLSVRPVPKYSNTLLAAYIAGSVRSQLDSGANKNDPVAGAEQVIETYLLLKKAEPDFLIAEVEKLID